MDPSISNDQFISFWGYEIAQPNPINLPNLTPLEYFIETEDMVDAEADIFSLTIVSGVQTFTPARNLSFTEQTTQSEIILHPGHYEIKVMGGCLSFPCVVSIVSTKTKTHTTTSTDFEMSAVITAPENTILTITCLTDITADVLIKRL
jgi:hypothetical protein